MMILTLHSRVMENKVLEIFKIILVSVYMALTIKYYDTNCQIII